MKYLLIILLFLTGCTLVNDPKELTYEVFSNHVVYDVTYLSYNGVLLENKVVSYEWKKTFPVSPGSPAYLKVVGDDTTQTIQVRIYYGNKLLFEELKTDSICEIETNIILY